MAELSRQTDPSLEAETSCKVLRFCGREADRADQRVKSWLADSARFMSEAMMANMCLGDQHKHRHHGELSTSTPPAHDTDGKVEEELSARFGRLPLREKGC